MQYGIGIPNQIRNVDPAVIPAWARRAESAGFSSLATVGRIAYPGVMDTVALAAAAGATSTIGLTSTVMLATVWPSVLLAKELAGIAGISGNRLTLGLGLGGDRPDDYVVESLPPKGLGRRMESDLATYQRIWRGDVIDGGENAAVPAGTLPIPLLFGGRSDAAMNRMARWGEGYIGGSLPAAMVEPMFESARAAWRRAGRDGAPKLVAIAYFSFADQELGRDNIYDYYQAFGDDLAKMISESVHFGAGGVKAAVKAFADLGVDEFIFNPAIPELNEIDKLAEAVL
jgi:alkanesulfonate monooxygenase SsuD/methylene tetrahydromethanopterin reductase-like flavin-dependent oxidoreductase (luciferase family)